MLVSQDEAMIEVFRRPRPSSPRSGSSPPSAAEPAEPRAHWECERAGTGGRVTIHGCTIEVDAVYGARD